MTAYVQTISSAGKQCLMSFVGKCVFTILHHSATLRHKTQHTCTSNHHILATFEPAGCQCRQHSYHVLYMRLLFRQKSVQKNSMYNFHTMSIV